MNLVMKRGSITPPRYSGNTNVWAGMSYDSELDYVYLPVSGATNNAYGGERPGNNLFAETLEPIS